jgi:hypothetical protein
MKALSLPAPIRLIFQVASPVARIWQAGRARGVVSEAVTFRQVLCQLKRDLIGKDSHRGVTLTYTWLANQFGHFSLGFIPSLVLTYILLRHPASLPAELRAAMYVCGFWTLFELINFLGPLLAAGAGGKFLLFRPKYTFSPAWRNIAFDTVTDILFFSFGAFTAAIFQQCYYMALEVSLALAVILLPISYRWYVTKMYLQYAEYPAQIRLGQWNNKIEDADKAVVQEFLAKGGKGRHLLVFGTKNSGKTPLGIAIATEKSIQCQSCMYISAMKLLSMFYEPERRLALAYEGVWSWRKVSTLVIDDISPGEPIHQEVIRPQTFARLLSGGPYGAMNREAIRGKNVIWVLGTDRADESFRKQWVDMLKGLGVGEGEIRCINLSRKGIGKHSQRI